MSTEQLNPLYTHWFRMEATKTAADIIAVDFLEGPIDEARLRDVIVRRLLPRPRFHRRVVDSFAGLRAPRWEPEPSFRIEDHFLRRTLEAPAVVSLGIMNVLGRSPAAIDHAAAELFARKGTVVITNVPGPREPLMIGGQRIKDTFFFVPHPSLCCGFSISSYTGMLRVGVRTDAAVMAEPEKLVAYFVDGMAGWTAA